MPRSSATAVSSGSHKGGYTPFTVELSDLLTYGEENTLLVRVDSTERTDFPPCGNVVDYLTYGGIYREVSLEVTEPDYVRTLRISPRKNASGESVQIELAFGAPLTRQSELRVLLAWIRRRRADRVERRRSPASAQSEFPHAEERATGRRRTPPCMRLPPSSGQDGALVDRVGSRFGLRFCEFRPDGFYLNGSRFKLLGLNRHQSFPYVGGRCRSVSSGATPTS